MAILLLDTSVIVDALKGRRGRNQLLDGLIAERNLLACCSINVTEIYAGMRPHEASATEALLRSFKFYGVSWEIARLAGELKNEWAQKGYTLFLPDVTIAAVAITHGLPLLTDNRKDFPMPELQLYRLPAAETGSK